LIAANDYVGLGCERQGKELIVFGIAAAEMNSGQTCGIYCDQKRTSPNCCDKGGARLSIKIAVELFAI
jgi:hypothetical protein